MRKRIVISAKTITIEVKRNNLNLNRYFVVDHENVVIGSKHSFASSYGKERVVQYDISSKQISEIISSSKKIFSDLMNITVSEKEDAKIWKSYDTIDEKKIIIVTVGLPCAFIGAVEAAPFIYAYGQSTLPKVTTELGKAFTMNTGRKILVNGSYNVLEQYATIGLTDNKWGLDNLRNIDKFDVGVSAFFSNFGGVVLKSAFDYKSKNDYGVNNLVDFSANLLVGSLKYKASSLFVKGIGKPLSTFTPGIGDIFAQGGKITIKTTIGAASKKIKEN
ncbi:hypothetical protein [uncultured Maribacter sp.]|uniref:hypothetical protein n=1 Tax=uncultured Maribacter sp. TaxID=431308 RepID=UPI002614EF48|nr:hypothetical protein [uncultured Maribacter sp.]